MGRISRVFKLGVLGALMGLGNAAYAWAPTISTADVYAGTFSSTSTDYYSSTRVDVSWTACTLGVCGFVPSGYKVRAYRGTTLEKSVYVGGLSTTITDLRAGQTYTFEILACATSACPFPVTSSTSGNHTVPIEMWQLDGSSTANSYATVTQVAWATTSSGTVVDGNVLPYVLYYPSAASAGPANYTRLAYNPNASNGFGWGGGGVRFNTTSSTGTSLANLTDFPAAEGNQGFASETLASSSGAGDLRIKAFQLVPLYDDSAMRVFYEADDNSGFSRLYSIDSLDGLTGLDYNNSSRGICGYPTANQPDLSTSTGTGYECSSILEVDVDTTPLYNSGDTGLTAVRQSKVGYPLQTDWRWDYTDTAFLAMTGTSRATVTLPAGGGSVGCASYIASYDSIFYALWDATGSTWGVELDAYGCPVALVDGAHGPAPTHLADGRYKMYYEKYDTTLTAPAGNCGKPLEMIFADADENTISSEVEYVDWDAANSSDVEFYWPDETLLDIYEESGLGDHVVLNLPAIGADPAIQIMYMNLGGVDGPGCQYTPSTATGSQGIGAAVLLNP